MEHESRRLPGRDALWAQYLMGLVVAVQPSALCTLSYSPKVGHLHIYAREVGCIHRKKKALRSHTVLNVVRFRVFINQSATAPVEVALCTLLLVSVSGRHHTVEQPYLAISLSMRAGSLSKLNKIPYVI